MKQYLSFEKIKIVFTTYFSKDYVGQLNESKIRAILNIYSDKKGGRTYIAKKLKLDQSVIGRIINKAITNNIIKRVLPSEFKTKETQRIYNNVDERIIYKVVRSITSIDRKLNKSISRNAKFKVQLPTGKHKPSTIVKYFKTKKAAENSVKDLDK